MLTPMVEGGSDTVADPSNFFDPAIPSSMDLIVPSQDSFNLMFQGMPYEVSEPIMCKSHFPMLPRPCGMFRAMNVSAGLHTPFVLPLSVSSHCHRLTFDIRLQGQHNS